jgi:hypothetical protein
LLVPQKRLGNPIGINDIMPSTSIRDYMVYDPRYGFIFRIPTVNQFDDLQSRVACLNFTIDDVLDCFFSCLSSWLAEAGRATALDDRNSAIAHAEEHYPEQVDVSVR